MEAARKEFMTWTNKKTHRLESKKRKVEALLNLYENEEKMHPPIKKKSKDPLNEEYKFLKEQLKQYVKKPEVEPFFSLKYGGKKAQLSFKDCKLDKASENIEPLFIEDIYQLLLKSVIGNMSPYPLNWARLEEPQKIAKTVLLVVEGFTKSDIIDNISELNKMTLFPHIVEIVSSNIPFSTELSTLHLVTDFHIQAKDSYSTMFPKEQEVKIDPVQSCIPPSKLHLLLSPIQMVMENYPFPANVFQYAKSDGYVFTKKSYAPVNENSPMFAVDCEMCRTAENPQELTRIAVVNEKLETIYHTLVKPEANIIDYMTRYSGITKEMLADVTIKHSDVQQMLQKLLPPDAILVGQSLNCDLHALKMIHPYVIDTSIIFNSSGIRGKKSSLKSLTYTFLNEAIQNKKDGHNPVEDSIAAMKLVQLKLQNGIGFGDACLVDTSEVKENASESNSIQASSDVTNVAKGCSKPKTVLASEKDNNGFFAKLAQFSKKACLIGNETSLNHYDNNMLNENIQKLSKPNAEKIVKTTLKQIEDNNLVISHLNFDLKTDKDSLAELNNILGEVYEACVDRTMFMVLISGVDEKNFADIKSGLFMTVLKRLN
ncbi:putative exonuclease C637.09 [Araneus ventricosus]|uniref:Putative exonuclease C637.09 n=1 Tax=Araneus ventricosus TaxID=182803 RepID=A0A4Y2Q292_ARAVE|nr:putative exonuclease C637.09 [Araneus ventricosus]